MSSINEHASLLCQHKNYNCKKFNITGPLASCKEGMETWLSNSCGNSNTQLKDKVAVLKKAPLTTFPFAPGLKLGFFNP